MAPFHHILPVKEVTKICLGSRGRDVSPPLPLSRRSLNVTLEEHMELEILLWPSLQNRICHTYEVELPAKSDQFGDLVLPILNYLREI